MQAIPVARGMVMGVYKSVGWLIRPTRIDGLLVPPTASAPRPCLVFSLTLAIRERLTGTDSLAWHSWPPSMSLVFPDKERISFPHVLPRPRRVTGRKRFRRSLAVLMAAWVTNNLDQKTVRRTADAIALGDYTHCDRGSNGERQLACGKWRPLRRRTISTFVPLKFRGCQDKICGYGKWVSTGEETAAVSSSGPV